MQVTERTKVAAIWLLKVGLGALFLYAGGLKLLNPSAFAEEIANYQLLPDLAPLMAATLPMVEIVIGICLVAAGMKNRWLPAAALGSVGLYAMFVVATSQVVFRGIDTSCGCFGADSAVVDYVTILRTSTFLGLSVLLLLILPKPVDVMSPT